MGRIILLLSFLVACSKQPTTSPLEQKRADRLGQLVSQSDWRALQAEVKNSQVPLERLLLAYALYQSNQTKELLTFVEDSSDLVGPYQRYLKILSAAQSNHHEAATALSVPKNLPRRLKARLKMSLARSWMELKNFDEARSLLEELVNDSRAAEAVRGEALVVLADLEWDLGLKEDSLKRYRRLYESFPLSGHRSQSIDRLQAEGQFQDIDFDTHLSRILRLQRAAQFERAQRELKELMSQSSGSDKDRLLLAQAQLAFAMRQYSRSLQLAQQSLRKPLPPDRKAEWLNLRGWSYVRLSQSDLGKKDYEELLAMSLPSSLRESLLFRLGATAVDDGDWVGAVKAFSQLRKDFPKGRFRESTHWFEAWSLYQQALANSPQKMTKLQTAIEIWEALPSLPEGSHFEPQALYWKGRAEILLGEEQSAQRFKRLSTAWPLSFYHLLLQEPVFGFISSREVHSKSPRKAKVRTDGRFADHLSWQRLEAFRSVHLMEWAQLEMGDFIQATQREQEATKETIAYRLKAIENWSDLVRWAERQWGRSIKSLQADEPHLQFLYPKAFEKSVLKAAQDFKISPFLIWGLMREESRFEPEAHSHAGAEGLMQLMPNLSRRIGRELGMRRYPGWTFDPHINTRLGTYHLAELSAQVRDFPVPAELRPALIVAAYNAGIDPVRRWVREKDTSRVDLFVESIPYTETRQYVKRVLQSSFIYSEIYGKEATK
jgi:soluble lytic murein transglycosylase